MELLPVAVEVVWNHIVAHSVDATLFRQYVSRLVEENLEVSKGYDCGMQIKNYNDIQENDIIEAYQEVAVKKKLK